jgi:hypothetical protein
MPPLGHVFEDMQEKKTCSLLRAEPALPVHGVCTRHLLLVLQIVLATYHEGCRVCFLPALYAIHPTSAWRLLLQDSVCDLSPSCACCKASLSCSASYSFQGASLQHVCVSSSPPCSHQAFAKEIWEVVQRMHMSKADGVETVLRGHTLKEEPATGLMVRMKRLCGPWNMPMQPRLSRLPSCSRMAESKVSCASAMLLLPS